MAADPLLPRRLRQLAWFTRGERRVSRAWFAAVTRFLDAVRPAVLDPARRGGLSPDASAVYNDPDLWQRLVEAQVMPEIRDLFRNPYTAVAPSADPDGDPYAIEYLQGARNRLQGVPDSVYSLIVADIERGIREGQSIPDIADAVQQTMTASGTPYWANRATTVARTEAIGATNAGAFAGAIRRAADEGDTSAEKGWISTMDTRTRPAHREADQQRVPLLQPFIVGGQALMFPGDPTGSAANVINCRCSILDFVAGEEIDWTNRGFQGED